MKRTVVVVSAFALASSMAIVMPSQAASTHAKATPVPKKAAARHKMAPLKKVASKKVAPADEYFGRLKLSILGIRNTIKDLGMKADYEPVKAGSILGSAVLAEDALQDWQRKYPLDPWIPKTAFSLALLYGKIPTDTGQKRAKGTIKWLIARYPSSSFSRTGREQLGAGRIGTPVMIAQTPAPDSQGAGGNPQSSGPPAASASAVPAPHLAASAVPARTPVPPRAQPANTPPMRPLGLPDTPAPPGSMPGTQHTQRPT